MKSRNYRLHQTKSGSKRLVKTVLLLIFTITAFNQSFAQFEMKKYTINSGGSVIAGGSFSMQSSVGQVDASHLLSGGNFQLNGGFWHENNDLIFTNSFENL